MAARFCSLKMHGSIVTWQYGTVNFALANCTSLTQARFIAIGENGDKKCFESESFAIFDNFRSATPDLVQSSPAQHCQFGYPVFCLAFRHSWMEHQDTWFSLSASVSLHSLATSTDQGFLKNVLPQFGRACLHFSLRRCHMHLKSYLMLAGGQLLWMKAEPN